MAVTLNSTLATRAANAIGPFFNDGQVEFRNASDEVLCTISFGASSWSNNDWVAQLTGTVVSSDPGNGFVVTKAVFEDGIGTGEMTVSVGATSSGADIEFDQTTWQANGVVTISSFSIDVPTS